MILYTRKMWLDLYRDLQVGFCIFSKYVFRKFKHCHNYLFFESPSTRPFPRSESVNYKIRLTAKPFLKNELYMSRKTNKFRIQGRTIIRAWASFKWPNPNPNPESFLIIM